MCTKIILTEVLKIEKKPVYNGYTEYYLTGAEIKERLGEYTLNESKHHSVPIRKLKYSYHLTKLSDGKVYRVFLSDCFCKIMDSETDKNITFFCWR